MSHASDSLPTVTVWITRPSDTVHTSTTFFKGPPIQVQGNVHWEPKRPSYVGRVRLFLRLKTSNDIIEVSSDDTKILNRVAGGFSWSGDLSTAMSFDGSGHIEAVAYDATENPVGQKSVNVEIQDNA